MRQQLTMLVVMPLCGVLIACSDGSNLGSAGEDAASDAPGSDLADLPTAVVHCDGAADGAVCNDGDPCTLDDVCASGVCVAGAVCDRGNACEVGTCEAEVGCAWQQREDGFGCAVTCFEGASCQAGQCIADLQTEIVCPQPGSDEPCVLERTCDGASGECTVEVLAGAGEACDTDTDLCTLESCDAAGACISEGAITSCTDLSDADACWTYGCDASTGSCAKQVFIEGNSCDDGNACSQGDLCVVGPAPDSEQVCVGTPLATDDGNPCTDDRCTDGAITHAPLDGVVCVLDNPCASAGLCEGDVCIADPCECQQDIDCAVTDVCAGTLFCDAVGTCQLTPGTALTCDDSDECTSDGCDPTSGCTNTPIACDDSDECTSDGCDPTSGCTNTPIACDDSDECTSDGCDPTSGCVWTPISCVDGDACTDEDCEAATGCTFAVTSCSDGDLCTDDGCDSGAGAGPGCFFTPVVCTDGQVCTDDSCVAGTCQFDAVSDGGPCPSGTCQGGGCVPDGPTVCTSVPCDPAAMRSPETMAAGLSVQGFDVSDDGSMTIAGFDSGTGAISVHCIDGTGATQAGPFVAWTLPANWQLGWNGIYVARADTSHHSVIAVSTESDVPISASQNASLWRLYFLDPSCASVGSYRDLPDTSYAVSQGTTEYFDIVMSDQGLTGAVYATRDAPGLAANVQREFALFEPDSTPVGAPVVYAAECSTFATQLAMNEATGDSIISCQNHASNPIYYQRFTKDLVPIDPLMVPFAPTDGNSSWYVSYTLGMNDGGEFMVAWQSSSANNLQGAFYDADASLLGQVAFGPMTGAVYDGYRRYHRPVQTLPDCGYVIPGPNANDTFPWWGHYQANSTMTKSQPVSGTTPSMRTDDSCNMYVVDPSNGSQILVNTAPFTL